MKAKALFLDRDNTLIVDKVYLADPAGVEILPGVREGLQRALDLGYQLFLFTNQSGIGRGFHTLEDTHRVNERMEELLGLPRPLFTDIGIAPESPDQPSVYRKPSPRFIHEMVAKYGLDPAGSIMVGDRESDIEAGVNAGIAGAAICSGKVSAEKWRELNYPNVRVYRDFAEFAASLT
jgi:D-glycero-D-manno-heptose 1,7-bisphosphate phosphatase